MTLSRRALLTALVGLAMPSPTEARLALRQAGAGVRDRLANRQDAILGLAGDGNGNVAVAGTGLILVRTKTGGRVLLAHNPSGKVWTEGELVEAIPLADRAPLGYRVAGKPSHIIFASLLWSSGTSYVSATRINEPWMINVGTGQMTAIGTHRFAPYTLETVKAADMSQPAPWQPLGISTINQSNRYRMDKGTLFWRSRLSEVSLNDGGAVFPFLQYHPSTGWERMEPNARTLGVGFVSTTDNARGEALDVDEDGTVVFIDTAAVGARGIKLVWRRYPAVPLAIWTYQDWPTIPGDGAMYFALPPDDSRIDSIDAGSGTPRTASFGLTNLKLNSSPVSNFINVYQADRTITGNEHATAGLGGNHFFQEVAVFDDASYFLTWRADGGVYRLRQWLVDATGTTTLRLDFGDGVGSWATVNTFVDTAPHISQLVPSPYRSGVFNFGFDTVSGPGNLHGAVTYYGPATLSSELLITLWHVTITATTVTKRAVVSVATPTGTAGTIQGHAVSNGKVYFSIGAGSAYTNPHIDPGIYEMDPVSYGIRQVVGMPAGLAGGGWGTVWGDRRSVPA